MLKLNEKMIRKGRPIGLPYQGSKKKISKKIVEIINNLILLPIYTFWRGAITAGCFKRLRCPLQRFENITVCFKRLLRRDYLKTLIGK